MRKPLYLLAGIIAIAASMTPGLTTDGKTVAKEKENKDKQENVDSLKKDDPYGDFLKENPEKHEGFINVYKSKGKVYFEMPKDIFGREMLIGSTVSEISDNGDALIGSKPSAPLHVSFSLSGEKVNLISVSKDYITDSDRPQFQKALDMNSAGAVIESFKVHSYNPDSTAVVFDVTDFFVSDNKKMRPFDDYSLNTYMGQAKRTPKYESKNSFLKEVKAFESSVTVKSVLSYTNTITAGTRTLAKDVPFSALVTRSILLLDEKPYVRRPTDSRIAIFPTGKYLFSEKEQKSEIVYFANRWRVEPSDTAAYRAGQAVEVTKPIVFYIDPAFPEGWKNAIYEAVNRWCDPFERIGLKNAVVAKPYPEDDPEFDPDNLKYSCIRYAPIGIENAMGPSWVDPRSGEIINASVYVYHDVVKLVNNWRFIQTAQADASVRSGKLPKDVLEDALRYVICHEVGHCLGLMHNMSASATIPVDSLRSPSFTSKYGTTHSIMDYARFNYVAQPGDLERGVRLTPPKFGLYDYFTIDYSYRPIFDVDDAQLRKLLSDKLKEAQADPVLRYGKQQGAILDPRSQNEDLGDNNVKASEYGVSNLKYILDNVNTWVEDDKDFSYRSEIYSGILYQYLTYVRHVFANIGGIYLYEKNADDPVEAAYVCVPRERQKEAFDFLCAQVRDLEWMDRPELMKNMPIMGTPSKAFADALVSAIVGAPRKVFNCEMMRHDEEIYTTSECLEDLFNFVWNSGNGKKLTEVDMMLQREFVKNMFAGAGFRYAGAGSSARNLTSATEGKFNTTTVSAPEFLSDYMRDCAAFTNDCDDTRLYAGYSGPGSVSGYEAPSTMFVSQPVFDSEYYSYIKKVQKIVKKRARSASGEEKAHYELLSRNIENTLK